MGTIQSGTGLASGLNYTTIIDALINSQKGTVNRLTTRVQNLQKTQSGLLQLTSRITGFKSIAEPLQNLQLYSNRRLTNSDSNQLSASVSTGTPIGTYQLQSLRKSSTHQILSQGFSSIGQTLGNGSITIAGGGKLTPPTRLDLLNGGAGVDAGSIRITDRSGASSVIDLSGAVTMDDVLEKINSTTDVGVKASVQFGKLVLEDTTGSSLNNLTVANVGGTQTAADLGIAQSVASSRLDGSDIFEVVGNFKLSQINDGLGIRTTPNNPSIRITLNDPSATQVEIDLNGAVTVQDIVNKINNSSNNAGKVSAELLNGRLVLHDLTGGGGAGTLAVEDINGSSVVKQLGLDAAAAGETLTGKSLSAGIQSVLLRNLRGGQGIAQLGSVDLTDRTGTTATLDLSNAETLDDLLSAINNAESSGNVKLQLKASLNSAGTGIVIADTSGSTSSNLIISDVGGSTLAADLGISVNGAQSSINSGSLNLRYLNEASSLTRFSANGALSTGSFIIKDSSGAESTIAVTSSVTTLGDLIDRINASSGAQVTAELNDTGDGLKLVDHAGGSEQVSVRELSGTVAANYRLLGTGSTVSGHSELSARKTTVVSFTAEETLEGLVDKLNAANAGLNASIIDNGASINSLRLSLKSKTAGAAGELLIESSGIDLGLSTSSKAQDAVLRVGNDAVGSYLLSSATNKFTGVVTGMDVELKAVGTQAAEIEVAADSTGIVNNISKFVENYNALVTAADELTSFDIEANTKGILQGNSIVSRVVTRINEMRNFRSADSNTIRSLVDLGVRVGESGKLEVDTAKLNDAVQNSPEEVKKFLYTKNSGFADKLSAAVTSLTDTVNGALTLESNSAQQSVDVLTNRITELNTILDKRRELLILKFGSLETTLSRLQQQQTAVSSFVSIYTSSTNSTKK